MMIRASSALAFFGMVAPLKLEEMENGRRARLIYAQNSSLGLIRSSRRLCGRILIRALVLALFIRTSNHRPRLQILLDQKCVAATRALLRNRFMSRSKFALRIITAAIKRVPLARALLNQFAVRAQRAFHAHEILFHVLALGIPAARSELAVTSMPDHHVPLALRAKFFQRNIGHSLALIQSPRGLAIRVTRAGHELPEAPALENHSPTAVFAILFLRSFLHVCSIEVRQIDRIFFGKRAAVRIFFIVRRAGIERAVLAPLDHQRRAATFALLVGRLLHTLDVLHVLGGVFEVLLELFVKLSKCVGPTF